MTILGVFRSRAQTLDFIARLSGAGVPVQTVNTPTAAKVGCGLSAKFDEKFLLQAKNVLYGGNYSAFAGFFGVRTFCGRTDLFRL